MVRQNKSLLKSEPECGTTSATAEMPSVTENNRIIPAIHKVGNHSFLYYIGAAHQLSANSRKKRFVNPIKIEVTRRSRMETILGKSPAIFNGHQPP